MANAGLVGKLTAIVALSALVAVLAVLASRPLGGQPPHPRARSADLQTGDFSQFSQVGTLNGYLANSMAQPLAGRRSAQATYCGGGSNGYARAIFNVQWPERTEVWYGTALYLPAGFLHNVQGEVDLLRWDDWGARHEQADDGGLVIFGSDHLARLVRGTYSGGANDAVSPPFVLPEGRWFWLEVHQRLSSASSTTSSTPVAALNEVYVDGRLVASSSDANTYGMGADRLRVGIVAVAAGSQDRPLSLWFDDPGFAASRLAPPALAPRAPAPRASAATATVGARCGS
jgi:hypothetical protein